MNTQYNTLTLASMPEEEKPSRAKLVVAAMFLVAVAGVVAFASTTSSQKVAAATNSEYKALDAAPVNCDSGTASYMSDLPRWDPEYSNEEDFYNACYYSFRCCTTTGNGNGCSVSDNFGAMCRSCLKDNSPRFVKKDCVDWIADTEIDTSAWTQKDLMEDNGVPPTDNPGYKVMFANYPGAPTEDSPVDTRSCWQPRGSGDKLVVDFAEKCFEVLSWCNLLCPRDTPQTVDHVMCKHCTLFGFQDGYFDHENWEKTLFGGEAGPKKIVSV
jgi:hypothetical protein